MFVKKMLAGLGVSMFSAGTGCLVMFVDEGNVSPWLKALSVLLDALN